MSQKPTSGCEYYVTKHDFQEIGAHFIVEGKEGCRVPWYDFAVRYFPQHFESERTEIALQKPRESPAFQKGG